MMNNDDLLSLYGHENDSPIVYSFFLINNNTVRSHLEESLQHSRKYSKMSTKSFRTYEEAIFELNSLQSNAETLAKSQSDRRKMSETNVSDTSKFLAFFGLNASHIDSLNCIHITGTKGKGSTAAFAESILRNLGFKTGFYSTSHPLRICRATSNS
ncbi:putative folylpolyglutamate synthase [Ditylenchus destructor]|uniref:Folylpolyglutamate synthase n=1 Tax=Ditylenchus destructor TaxID=166010 RepID=A0AAD4N4F6_9BILA|nr:putative folylpolyglutamate synthase [Ditylenchus destructor]